MPDEAVVEIDKIENAICGVKSVEEQNLGNSVHITRALTDCYVVHFWSLA